ncbi:MAG: choice-of-anchor D domain-containing protein [Calditrichaeota bacterium]|nr:choice-of-anchor D domain-containing protein [Calditrichota bacterium]MCB9365728.1 choice-of-anchor D domain-containing protein [Calditrichota bacterium]
MRWLLLLLMAAVAAAQPAVDSVFVFEDLQGPIVHAQSLPDGGYLLAGLFSDGTIGRMSVVRTSAEREVLWQRGFRSSFLQSFYSLSISGERVLLVGTEEIPIDSVSSTSREIAACYTLDGDSLWAETYDTDTTFTSIGLSVPDGYGGFYLLGNEGRFNGQVFNQDVRLLRVDSTGAVIWQRFLGDENTDTPLGLVKLDGDTIVFAAIHYPSTHYEFSLTWVNADGDSLTERRYNEFEEVGVGYSSLLRRDDGFEIVWGEFVVTPNDSDAVRWIRTDEEGDLIHARTVAGPENFLKGFRQTDDGFLTAGYSPFDTLVDRRNAVLGRLSSNGFWYYIGEVPQDGIQEAYGFLPNTEGPLTMFGRTAPPEGDQRACLFYFADEASFSYLYAEPPQLDFGVVPINEVATRSVTLHSTGDSVVTVTDILLPDQITSNVQLPHAILPGDSFVMMFGFRPEVLRHYADTVRVMSDAQNSILEIRYVGSPPFPECTPGLRRVDLFWVNVGQERRRPLAINNTGTATLNILPLEEPAPFYLDSLGPFTIEPDSTALLWITFRPDTAGEYEVDMLIFSDDPGSPDTVTFVGRGLGGQAADDRAELPREFRLYPAFPNPFNPSTTIAFDLPSTASVSLRLFDVTGRLVRTLADGTLAAGQHRVLLDAHDLATGLYFAALETGEYHSVQKLLLVK